MLFTAPMALGNLTHVRQPTTMHTAPSHHGNDLFVQPILVVALASHNYANAWGDHAHVPILIRAVRR